MFTKFPNLFFKKTDTKDATSAYTLDVGKNLPPDRAVLCQRLIYDVTYTTVAGVTSAPTFESYKQSLDTFIGALTCSTGLGPLLTTINGGELWVAGQLYSKLGTGNQILLQTLGTSGHLYIELLIPQFSAGRGNQLCPNSKYLQGQALTGNAVGALTLDGFTVTVTACSVTHFVALANDATGGDIQVSYEAWSQTSDDILPPRTYLLDFVTGAGLPSGQDSANNQALSAGLFGVNVDGAVFWDSAFTNNGFLWGAFVQDMSQGTPLPMLYQPDAITALRGVPIF